MRIAALRARNARPRRCRSAEQSYEFAPPHGAHPQGQDHGLSIAGLECQWVHRNKKRCLMSELGHSLPIDTPATCAQCPLLPDSVRTLAPQRNDATCQERTYAAQQMQRYAIASSALATSVAGKARPSAFGLSFHPLSPLQGSSPTQRPAQSTTAASNINSY